MQTRKKMAGHKSIKQRTSSSAISLVDPLTQEFCDIVSDEKKSKADIQRFLEKYPGFDINTTATLSGVRPVHYAMQYGSLNSIQFLIEELFADLTIINYYSNFLLIQHKPEIKKYIFEKKLWNKLGDGTTDLHGYAWAGKFDLIVAELANNPDRISELNDDNKSIFNWAAKSIKENVNMWAQHYCNSLNPKDSVRLRNYYHCLARTELNERNFTMSATYFLAAFNQQALIGIPSAEDFEIEDQMKRGLSEVYFNEVAVTKDAAVAAQKHKECLRVLNSITNKTREDIAEYIRYCGIIANTYRSRAAFHTSYADERMYSGDTFAALDEYQLAEQALQSAQRLVTAFPKEISVAMAANDDLVDLIKSFRDQVVNDFASLNPKLDFIYSACGLERPTDVAPAPVADEKMEVDEEEEKIPLTSPAALRGSMYHASTLAHSISSSNTAQPPPPADDNDIKALHHR